MYTNYESIGLNIILMNDTYKCKQSRKASEYKRTKIWTITKEEMLLVNNYRQSVQTLINKSIQMKRKREHFLLPNSKHIFKIV